MRIVRGLASGIMILFVCLLFTFSSGNASYASSSAAVVAGSILIGERDEGYSPFSVAVNQATNIVYVTSPDSNAVSVINATMNKVIDTITVGLTPVDIAVNQNTNLIYVANGNSGTVSIIDGSTNKVLKTLSVTDKRDFYSIGGIAVNERTNRVYILVNNDLTKPAYASISIIDGSANNSLEQTFNVTELRTDYDVTDGAKGIAVNSETNMIYVTTMFGSLHVLDGSNNKVVATLATGRYPHQVEVNEETNMVYVSNFNSQTVSVIDGSTNKIIKTVWVGPDPRGIAIDSLTNMIYVAGGSVVSIINGSSHQVESKVEIGSFPTGVAFNQNNKSVYVAKWQSDSVFVIKVDNESSNDRGSVMPLSSLRQNTTSGNYIVELGWEFRNADNVTLLVFFFDGSGTPLDYVQYDLVVRNASNGKVVQQFTDQIPAALYATPNIGYHDIAFEKGGNNIEIDVIIEASSQELVVSNDKAAFDIVVVPEFNLSILAAMMAMAIGIAMLKTKRLGMKI